MVEKKLFGINRICILLGLSKKTYYYGKSPEDRQNKKYLSIKVKLRKIIKRHPKYGVMRIKADLLRRFKVDIGRDTLSGLLKLWALSLPPRVAPPPPSGISQILCRIADKANLLIRTEITAPFQAMSTDMTELIFNHGKNKLYLSVHKDVFGQMVYGWKMSEHQTEDLCLDSFQLAKAKIEQLTHQSVEQLNILQHQDRGSQYTGYHYVDTVLTAGARLSYSDPGTPTHNPGQESFFGRFKAEWADEIYELETAEEVIKFVNEKIIDYNTDRLHTSLGNTPPAEFTKKFLKIAVV
jgi:putative transposase